MSEFRINRGQQSLFDPVQLLVALGPEIFRKALEVSQFSFFYFSRRNENKKQSKCRKNLYERERDLPLLVQDSYNEFEDKHSTKEEKRK